MVSVEQWAWLRREHFVGGVSIKRLERQTGLSRNTIRKALRSPAPPAYSRPARGSKLEPFKEEIHSLLRGDAELESQRIRELLIEQGFEGGKTIVDDYVREVRPFFRDQRSYQRTAARHKTQPRSDRPCRGEAPTAMASPVTRPQCRLNPFRLTCHNTTKNCQFTQAALRQESAAQREKQISTTGGLSLHDPWPTLRRRSCERPTHGSGPSYVASTSM